MREFIVCYVPGFDEPVAPYPNTPENVASWLENHGGVGVVKSRLVTPWEKAEAPHDH